MVPLNFNFSHHYPFSFLSHRHTPAFKIRSFFVSWPEFHLFTISTQYCAVVFFPDVDYTICPTFCPAPVPRVTALDEEDGKTLFLRPPGVVTLGYLLPVSQDAGQFPPRCWPAVLPLPPVAAFSFPSRNANDVILVREGLFYHLPYLLSLLSCSSWFPPPVEVRGYLYFLL